MPPVTEARIEADPTLPIIRITRDFDATPLQLFLAHTDPELFARWVGPDGLRTRIDYWDARRGGSWRYVTGHDDQESAFHGSFHDVRTDRIVQTFTYEGIPDGVALETLRFEELGRGRTRLHAQSLCDSFEDRDAWLSSGMEVGVNQGYAKLDGILADGALADPGPARRHREFAGAFTDRVVGTKDWDAPAPVDGWTARDVVRHLTDWFPGFLAAGAGVELDRGPSVDVDPVTAWQVHSGAVQALLADPATPGRTLSNPHIGEVPLDQAIDRFYTSDVFMHTWDLARATGQQDRLDDAFCAQLLAGMEQMEEAIRSSGQYGSRVPVPEGADAQTRLLGFIGRDPFWTAAS